MPRMAGKDVPDDILFTLTPNFLADLCLYKIKTCLYKQVRRYYQSCDYMSFFFVKIGFSMTAYLDFSATTPVLPEVAQLVYQMMVKEYGNADSRTHEYGLAAKRAVEIARAQIAEVVHADKSEVIFTSGATESNNIAILGLRDFANQVGKHHIITSKIEHNAVIQPIKYLEQQGFDVTYLDVLPSGKIDIQHLKSALRDDTFLVSIMHINNETGVIQPILEVCDILSGHDAYFHVDAAQSFGKYPYDLENNRIDFISASGHKIYAPKGVGALIMRRRGFMKPPLAPVFFGGGQERGLRPGTLASPLIAGFGLAASIAKSKSIEWCDYSAKVKSDFLLSLSDIDFDIIGDDVSPYVLNVSIKGVNSEAAMVKLKGIIAVSNGSACSSKKYETSYVLKAMGLSSEKISSSLRISFGPMCSEIPVREINSALLSLVT